MHLVRTRILVAREPLVFYFLFANPRNYIQIVNTGIISFVVFRLTNCLNQLGTKSRFRHNIKKIFVLDSAKMYILCHKTEKSLVYFNKEELYKNVRLVLHEEKISSHW